MITLVMCGRKQQLIGFLKLFGVSASLCGSGHTRLSLALIDSQFSEDTAVVKSVGSGARPCTFQLSVHHFLVLRPWLK